MHMLDALIILIIGQTLVVANVVPSNIEVSSKHFSDYRTIENTTQHRGPCSQGTFVEPAAAGEKDRADNCVQCPSGHFMPEENHNWTQCKPCYTPDWTLGEVEDEPCNSTQDTVVMCQLDFFLQENRCINCRLCSFNDSMSECVASCCKARGNSTGGASEGVEMYDCSRHRVFDHGSNDWRIVFLVGLLGITLFSFFICVWRGVFKSGNRAGKAGCIRYKRIRTLSNSI